MSSLVRSNVVILGVAVRTFDDGPRVSHLEVANRLGYRNPHVFTKLVEGHLENLSRFGVVSSEGTNAGGRGRRGIAYFLNRKQVLWLCMKSEQDLALDVAEQMVHVFDEALDGPKVGLNSPFWNQVFLPAPQPWDAMFEDSLVRALCKLDGHDWRGGSHPRFLASTNAKIYDTILGSEAWQALRSRNPDAFSGTRHHQLLRPEPRVAFRDHLARVELLASQSATKAEFWERMHHAYGGGTLQLSLTARAS